MAQNLPPPPLNVRSQFDGSDPPSGFTIGSVPIPLSAMQGLHPAIRKGLELAQQAQQPFSGADQPGGVGGVMSAMIPQSKTELALAAASMLPLGRLSKALRNTKVVDEAGSPIRVYHGTQAAYEAPSADSFHSGGGVVGPGYYTTENHEVASGYAETGRPPSVYMSEPEALKYWSQQATNEHGRAIEDVRMRGTGDMARVEIGIRAYKGAPVEYYPAPRRIPGTPAPNVRAHYLNIQNPLDLDAQSANPTPDIAKALERHRNYYGDRTPLNQLSGDEINWIAKQAGYDGITHIGGERTGGVPHRVWVAFHPDQVIPAFGGPNEK